MTLSSYEQGASIECIGTYQQRWQKCVRIMRECGAYLCMCGILYGCACIPVPDCQWVCKSEWVCKGPGSEITVDECLTAGGHIDGSLCRAPDGRRWVNSCWCRTPEVRECGHNPTGNLGFSRWSGSACIVDTFSGRKTKTYANGDKYEGDWVNDRRQGKGIFTHAYGDKYEGDWINDQRQGKGICTYANGDKYEGDWVHNKRASEGTYTCSNGRQFTGNFKNNVPVGFTIICN